MNRKTARLSIIAMIAVAALLGACSGSSADASASTAPIAVSSLTASATTASPTATPAASTSASPVGGSQGSAAPASIDPCTLLTSAEASNLIGAKLGAGVSESLGPDRACTFRAGLKEVRVILPPTAPDADTAKAYYDALRAEAATKIPAEFPGVQIHVTDLTLFDRSAYLFASGSIGSLSAIYVLDGAQGFEIFCALTACSQNALTGGADLVAGRLP